MIIRNNNIEIANGHISIGMSFVQAENILKDIIYTKAAPNEKGIGHIILKNIDFYGLYGKCTIYFQNECITQFGFTPEWNMYELTDSVGNRMPIDKAIERVAFLSKEGLKAVFGEPSIISEYGNEVFVSDKLNIISTFARSGENYSVIVR